MNDIMIDLETLSTRHDAAILSIGAAVFDIRTGEISATFEHGVSMSDRDGDYGHIHPETVSWWIDVTSDQAKKHQLNLIQSAGSLKQTLREFSSFVSDLDEQPTNYWSNGSTFDLVILRSAYTRCGLEPPFLYFHERDVRTIVDLGRRIHDFDPKHDGLFNGIEHSALADALHQAKYVSAIYQKLVPRTQ